MRSVGATVKPVRKHQNDAAALADSKVPELPVIFVVAMTMSLLEAK